ncbi:aminotransferase A [Paenalkalicoccus suaedae]|uniref:Aminotransferase n=1 Tax=Paenalkalicoccus suaedae TaxID=2592382 RepID=A0A859FD73_9BACI|nr:aminotransferase A [Paenalkalicoccus suaedae]QKS71169.1 aminotransferase A [Paenalkalicoccus suaedae]
MEHRINPAAASLKISGIRQFFQRVQQYPNAVQLTLGQPDFPTPDHIKDAAKRAIDQNKTTYTPNAGIMELREAISHHAQDKYSLEYRADSEIIVTVGASQAIDVALRTILEQGDEVILPGPVYPAYEPIIRLCGGKPVYVDTTMTGFKLTVEAIESTITSKTKAVFLPYPSNPTGVVLSEEELTQLAHYLKQKDLFILSDEIYSELCYTSNHKSIATFPGMREKTIVINGLSKSHSMTGWRIGYLMAPEEIAKHMLKVHQYNVSCASSISQYAALEAIKHGAEDPLTMKSEYNERRRFVMKRLHEIGMSVEEPFGAFYVFPSIKESELSSFDFAVKLLEEEELAVVPGDAFSPLGEGFIRLSYAYSMSELHEAMERMERFWKRILTN